jgi:hypothetical protein
VARPLDRNRPSDADEPAGRLERGFAALAALIGPDVGTCLEDEQPDPGGGKTIKRTTAGLL